MSTFQQRDTDSDDSDSPPLIHIISEHEIGAAATSTTKTASGGAGEGSDNLRRRALGSSAEDHGDQGNQQHPNTSTSQGKESLNGTEGDRDHQDVVGTSSAKEESSQFHKFRGVYGARVVFEKPSYNRMGPGGGRDAIPAQVIPPDDSLLLGIADPAATGRAAPTEQDLNGSMTLFCDDISGEESVRERRAALCLLCVLAPLWVLLSILTKVESDDLTLTSGIKLDETYDNYSLVIVLLQTALLVVGWWSQSQMVLALVMFVLYADAFVNLVRQHTAKQWGVFIVQLAICEFLAVYRGTLAPKWKNIISNTWR